MENYRIYLILGSWMMTICSLCSEATGRRHENGNDSLLRRSSINRQAAESPETTQKPPNCWLSATIGGLIVSRAMPGSSKETHISHAGNALAAKDIRNSMAISGPKQTKRGGMIERRE
jgi:hypothetical protein